MTTPDLGPDVVFYDNDRSQKLPKISAIMLEFAEPLLEIARSGPPSLDALRSAMELATLCWNAPLGQVYGEDRWQRELEFVLKNGEPAVRAALRSMLALRMTRYASVRFAVFATMEGLSGESARCSAYALALPEQLEAFEQYTPASIPLSPTGCFAEAFPELEGEQKRWTVGEASGDGLPPGSYLLEERYCADFDCDCRRVQLHVLALDDRRVLATIGYAFDPPPAKHAALERQIELEMFNPQSELSDAVLARFEAEIATDAAYRPRLIAHYEAWKSVVDDPAHPAHATLGVRHREPLERVVYPRRREPVRSTKVGANQLCPCGSGRKYKRCCRVLAG